MILLANCMFFQESNPLYSCAQTGQRSLHFPATNVVLKAQHNVHPHKCGNEPETLPWISVSFSADMQNCEQWTVFWKPKHCFYNTSTYLKQLRKTLWPVRWWPLKLPSLGETHLVSWGEKIEKQKCTVAPVVVLLPTPLAIFGFVPCTG